MPIIPAKCTSCGASLNVDSTKDASICEYCRTPFIVEKAINNYNISNTNNISDSVVNIYSGSTSEFDIIAGKLTKYNGSSPIAVIPDTVNIIGEGAFSKCEGLQEVKIPNSVTHIKSAFDDCTRLKSITIPNSVISIDLSFNGCINLHSITLPNSLTTLNSSFNSCTSLQSITLPNDIVTMDSSFNSCTSLQSITLPNRLQAIRRSFGSCIGLQNIGFPNPLTEIYSSFNGCAGLRNLSFPSGVTLIGNVSFKNCMNLSNVSIPNASVRIEDGAFVNCQNLREVKVSNAESHVEAGAFAKSPFGESVLASIKNKKVSKEKQDSLRFFLVTAITLAVQVALVIFGYKGDELISEDIDIGLLVFLVVTLPYAANASICPPKKLTFITRIHMLTIAFVSIVLADTMFLKVVGTAFYLAPVLLCGFLMRSLKGY